jgi:hypothetical protein
VESIDAASKINRDNISFAKLPVRCATMDECTVLTGDNNDFECIGFRTHPTAAV